MKEETYMLRKNFEPRILVSGVFVMYGYFQKNSFEKKERKK